MAKLTKRQKAIAQKIEAGKQYGFEEAATLLSELSAVKFAESFDIAINLGVDPRKTWVLIRVNPTRSFVVQPFCRTAPARPFALPCSLRALLPKQLWLLAPIALVWTSWLPR